jgi:hypothetical protein
VKYATFRGDSRAQLLVDDSTSFRAVLVPATVEVREDVAAELPRFRVIQESTGGRARRREAASGTGGKGTGPAGHDA